MGRPGASREMDLRPEQPPLAWDPLLGVLACSCLWTNLPRAKLRCRVPICAPCTRSFAMTFFPSRPASAACSRALDGVRASTLPQPHPFSARACRTLRECAGSSLTRGLRPLPALEPCVGRPGARLPQPHLLVPGRSQRRTSWRPGAAAAAPHLARLRGIFSAPRPALAACSGALSRTFRCHAAAAAPPRLALAC